MQEKYYLLPVYFIGQQCGEYYCI